MSKPGNSKHKVRYQTYKSQGRRERNKALKQERAQRRIEKFKARKASGATYEYKSIEAPKESREFRIEKELRARKIKKARLDYAHTTSCFRKLRNYLEDEKKRQKKGRNVENGR